MSSRIVGICRFAFVGKGDWIGMSSPSVVTDSARQQAQARRLFAPDRMRLRLHTLRHICLASLAGQSDQDFDFIVLSSAIMPADQQAALAQVCAALPQVRLVFSDATSTEEALRPLLLDIARRHGGPALQFRLDDDDGLGAGYVAALRMNARRVAGQPRYALSFPRGISVVTYEGRPPGFWRFWRPFNASGAAARLLAPGRSIFAVNHFELPRVMFAALDPAPLGQFVLRWDDGDTARDGTPRHPWGYEAITAPEFAAQVAQDMPWLSGFDWDALRRVPVDPAQG